jgi:2-amino-4-hydroxy-6-hydroxymethyldihydropteridine diphosphokinase
VSERERSAETAATRHVAFLALGSNLGDRAAMLQLAVDDLAAVPGIRVTAVSAVYETAPVGGPEQDDYLNAVVALDTELAARALLEVARRIEEHAGRVRTVRWGPRSLDVDVLLVGDERVDEPDLQVPHPRMRERGFVLAPLRDVAPDEVTAPAGGWEGVRVTPVELRLP